MERENCVAIVGYSGSFSGAASGEELWQMVSQGRVGLSKSSAEEIARNLPKELAESENFIPVGGGPEDYKTFDARFFGYSPKEALYL